MEASPNSQAALAEIIERYGGTLETFRRLRKDCYEHALARQSLERLEQLYAELFRPGQILDEARLKCPPWPPGTKREGRLPSKGILSEITERFNTESTLNNLSRVQRFTQKVEKRAETLAAPRETLETIMRLLEEELIAARLGGQLLSTNLEVIDRLQSQAVIGQKDRQIAQKDQEIALSDRRVKLLESKMRAASDEVKKLRGKGADLNEEERTVILDKVDEILGIK